MAFALTTAAVNEVRRRANASRYTQPAASLFDGTQFFRASDKLTDEELDYRLDVGIYDAQDCLPEDLVIIGGVRFAIPKLMLEYFDDYVLDFVDDHFVLRNGQRTLLRLMDLAKQ
jgi:hypothetical protein